MPEQLAEGEQRAVHDLDVAGKAGQPALRLLEQPVVPLHPVACLPLLDQHQTSLHNNCCQDAVTKSNQNVRNLNLRPKSTAYFTNSFYSSSLMASLAELTCNDSHCDTSESCLRIE